MPIFPTEIMDIVIDELHTDLRTLCVCALVCSEWLCRSRYHLFSTIQLFPGRAQKFFDLACSQTCTFIGYVSRLELDDVQYAHFYNNNDKEGDVSILHEIMTSSSVARFSHISSLCIRNVDWTAFPFPEQDRLRACLASFVQLQTLEFHDVMFHDLREIVRIVALFPSLTHLNVNVQFSKYMVHTVASATALVLPDKMEGLALGSDDAIPAFLSCSFNPSSRLMRLVLDGVKFWHLQYIGKIIRSAGIALQHIHVNFSGGEGHWINANDFSKLDLSQQLSLRSLHLGGIQLATESTPRALENGIPFLLSTINSKVMESVTLGMDIESSAVLDEFNWNGLEQAVLRMQQNQLRFNVDGRIVANIPADAKASLGIRKREKVAEAVKTKILAKLSRLRRTANLNVQIKA